MARCPRCGADDNDGPFCCGYEPKAEGPAPPSREDLGEGPYQSLLTLYALASKSLEAATKARYPIGRRCFDLARKRGVVVDGYVADNPDHVSVSPVGGPTTFVRCVHVNELVPLEDGR